MSLRPTAITSDRTERLLIVPWNDGHVSRYAFRLLREACPCAECNEYRNNRDPLKMARSVSYELASVELVGSYALQLNWADGHRWGIYSWDILRAMCPCDECQSGRLQTHG